MFKNKKTSFVGILTLVLALAGCGQAEGTTSEKGKIDKAEYLNTEALEKYKQSDETTQYKVHTLEKGDYVEEILSQTMEWRTVNLPAVRLEAEGADIRFGEYQVSMFDMVKEGDVLATIFSETDEIALEQAQIKLQRLQERYEAAKVKQAEKLEEILENRSMIYNDYERAVADINYKQSELDFANTARNYEYQITQAKKALDEIVKNQTQKVITAHKDGFIFFETRQATGKELKNGDYICTIVNVEDFYLWTDTQSDLFGYGMDFDFTNGVDKPSGTVINGGSKLLYGNLDQGNTYFKTDIQNPDMLAGMLFNNTLKIKGNAKQIQDVVLVPKSAVSETENGYFVTVLTEEGKLLKTEFLPGGSNSEYYWVLKGLSEGMKVIQDGGL